jgi:hypothetical protein
MRRLLVLAVSLVGCGPADVPCNQMMMPSDLVGQAQLMRLDVFDASVHCAGATVTAGAPAPSLTQVAPAGTPIHLNIPSGHHTLLLSAFADSTGTQLIATACTETDLEAGASVCFNLSLVETPDLAVDNDARATCSASPDNCPVGQYCAVDGQCASGCKNADDCMGGSSAKLCDTAMHRCVECLAPNDCPPGKVCSPSGSCVMGCDVSAGSNCPGMQQCCSSFCTDTTSDISSCGACGRACDSTHVTTPSCTGNVCAPACANGYGDCNHPVAPNADDGCETNLHDVAHCGGCNTTCTLANATAKCPSGTCQIESCGAGHFDCDGTASNGCECAGMDLNDGMKGCCPAGTCQTMHTDGYMHTFYDCVPSGTYNVTVATDAARAYDPTVTNSVFSSTCTSLSGSTVSIVCNRNMAQTKSVAWAYADTATTGSVVGRTNITTHPPGPNSCTCPAITDLPWN